MAAFFIPEGLMPEEAAVQQAPLTLETAAQAVVQGLRAEGAMVILSHADGSMTMLAHGVNHWRANEMLSRSIQMNLNQHDQFVLQGAAGQEAMAAAQRLLEANAAGGVQ